MGKVQKIGALAKLCVKKPKTIAKGAVYLAKYGVVGFSQNMKSRAAYETSLNNESSRPVLIPGSIHGSIKFSIVVPVYNVETKWLKKAINSVEAQTYDNWELCLVDDCSTDENVGKFLRNIDDHKIKIKFMEQNSGISKASNAGVDMATGEYILLMDNDDEINPFALEEFYKCISNTKADIVYSDQDIIDMEGNHSAPLFKPDWSPDLFRSQMYLGHLIGFKKELFEKVGGFRSEFNGSQDYDLLLRMTEQTSKIEHISKVLYSWRSLPTSTATNAEAKPYAQTAGLKAVQEHLDRVYGKNQAIAKETEDLFVYDVRYRINGNPKISIIIPTKDHADDLKKAIDSIVEKTTYKNYEIIILNNNSKEKETFEYFDELKDTMDNVIIEDALYEFNWSRLNNHGIRIASGDVFLCLNNDVEVINGEWLERIVENAMREEIGTVGGLLLYFDGTIQHAGIVAGMGGWADHVFKGMKPVHYGSPFVSPMVTRNVTASTGGCLAFSRRLYDKIGGFDERFIICGSDVELSIRALQAGYYNVYVPYINLYHYESKSRDSYIPEIDFDLSYHMYAPYRKKGDPFYNINLDYMSCIPTAASVPQFVENVNEEVLDVRVPEIEPMKFRVVRSERNRINIIVPSINVEHVFGGISTALKFFDRLTESLPEWDKRIILSDAAPNKQAINQYSEKYKFVLCDKNSDEHSQIVAFADRNGRTLPVSDKDVFIFTGWWTAYCVQEEYHNLQREGKLSPNPFVYFIQDYEPGFYPWSTRYMMADSTYKCGFKQIAVFNSHELKEFFDRNGYDFYKKFEFDPLLNATLRDRVQALGDSVNKKKQILVYGRPGTARNAFELLVAALKKWVEIYDEADEWTIISAGEAHPAVELGKGLMLCSSGKLSIEEYASVLEESYAGISLMVSPHPSYPPLEMSVFDVKVITNTYANKDLSSFNDNIISLEDASTTNIADNLVKICEGYKPVVEHHVVNENYCSGRDVFTFMDGLVELLNNK